MTVHWDDYRVFLAIARHRTLSGAARGLGLSQPTVGRRLQALEEALARPLFQRTSGGYVLTSEGHSILASIEEMEEQASAVQRRLTGESQLKGMVRVSTTEWFGAHLLAPVFADIRLDYPDLIIELVTETRLISLARREADIGFRFREFEEPDVVQTRVADIAFSAYASQSYLRRRSDAGARKEHILITMDTNFDSLADVAWLSQRLPHATAGLRANSRDVQAKLCAAGGGVAVLPNCVGDSTAGLVRLDLQDAPPGRTVWAGYHKDLKRSPRVRTVLQSVLHQLRETIV